MRRGRVFGWAAVVGLAVPLALGGVPAYAAKAPAKPYDFNGDGQPELAVGAPGLTVSGHQAAGGLVVVQPTTRTKPKKSDAKLFTQSTSKVAGASEYNDNFGAAVASGDFDRDGYADLAVGLPGEDFSKAKDAGAVTILYGSKKGLTGKRSAQISEPAGKHPGARFGTSLAVGDLNGDGFADLAVGAPGDAYLDESGPAFAQGTVTVLDGGKQGVSNQGAVRLHGVRSSEPDTYFGTNLAVADVDADGRADVVVLSGGVDNSENEGLPGSLSFCAGGGKGAPSDCRRLVRSDDLRGASALVVGNVAGDDRPEIVAGGGSDPEFDSGHIEVATLSGTASSTTASVKLLDNHDFGVSSGGAFGDALALGDFGGDAHADLAIGAWAQDEGDDPAGGSVFLVHGGTNGLATSGNTTIDQDTPGVPGSSESEDDFGYALTVVDRNRDGRPDLVVGNPDEEDTGRVTTLRSTGSGLTTTGAGTFGLSDLGIKKGKESGFGAVLGQ